MIAGEDDGPGDAGKGKKDERSSTPAPSAAAQAAQIRSLREACKRNGRGAEFEALEKSGADMADLRSLLIASIALETNDGRIGRQAPVPLKWVFGRGG